MDDGGSSREDTNVRVAVRCRPFNSKEKANGEESCVQINSEQVILINPAGHNEEHSFAFDIVFDEDSRQESVWTKVGEPILEKAFNGFNGTIFAYGQTGSGKTWSMQGADGELKGIIPRLNANLFARVDAAKKERPTMQFLITVAYFEIYNEVIFDLLDVSDRKKKHTPGKGGGLEIKEHAVLGVYVKGLNEIVTDSAEKLQSIIDQGMRNRTVASTQMNADSSRSHSVFMVKLHQKDSEDESKNIFAKINLVDLAGSERVKSTGATGAILKEGANINKSLSALGNVINALVEASKGKGTFIPYRNSKLTRVLQESLGGNSITAMLAAMSPAASNFEETLSTLKYANRAKAIKVKAVKNEESSQISRLNEEIRMLKEKLMADGGVGRGGGTGTSVDISALEEKNRQQLRDLEEAMKNTWEEKAKLSTEYEKDKQRMQLEKAAAARKMEAARQRNWAMLEQKADLEITLGHVRSLLMDRNVTGPASSTLGHWVESLREITALERALAAQDTIVQVYRTSLQKDSSALKQQIVQKSQEPTMDGSAAVLDNTAIGMQRQMKDKFMATSAEMDKWVALQEELLGKMESFAAHIFQAGNLLDSIRPPGGFAASGEVFSANQNQQPHSGGGEAGAAGGDSNLSDVLTSADEKEIMRGVRLIRRQMQQKQQRSKQSVAISRREFLRFDDVVRDLINLLQLYGVTAEHYEELISSSSMGDDMKSKFQVQNVQSKITEAIEVLGKVTGNIERSIEASSSAAAAATAELAQSGPHKSHGGHSGGSGSGADPNGLDMAAEIGPLDGVTIENFEADKVTKLVNTRGGNSAFTAATAAASGSVGAAAIAVDGDYCWSHSVSDAESGGAPTAAPAATEPLVLRIPAGRQLTSLVLQGGALRRMQTSMPHGSSSASADSGGSGKGGDSSRDKPSSRLLEEQVGLLAQQAQTSGLKLPCGITLGSCDGNIEMTAAALGDVMDWSQLLKSNPPEKFLKRPPVRFMFDLVHFIALSNPGYMPEELSEAQWPVVGLDKASKLEFMNKVIYFVTSSVRREEPVTSGTSIVTGSNPELTNQLLQQMAVGLYCFQQKLDIADAIDSPSSAEPQTEQHNADSSAAVWATSSEHNSCQQPKVVLQDAWVSHLTIEVSSDGLHWSKLGSFATGLQAQQQATTLSLDTHGAQHGGQQASSASSELATAAWVRLTPEQWNGGADFGPAMRVQLLGIDTGSETGSAGPGAGTAREDKKEGVGQEALIRGESFLAGQQSSALIVVVETKLLEEVVAVLLGTLTVMIETVSYLGQVDHAHKEHKQLQVKQNLENLAKEKQALEQLLASEKQSLESNNQDLAEQLKNCFNQLRDTKALLEKEQEMTQQLDRNCRQLQEDKASLQQKLANKEQENASLQTDVMRLQANYEKDRSTITTMQETISDQERSIETMKEQLQQADEAQAALEGEREELNSQIQVLTEERDAARAEEEDLFEKLSERTIDLERLQESYVHIADRCNDAQDEVMDLREKLEALQEAFANRAALQTSLPVAAAAAAPSPAPAAVDPASSFTGSNSSSNSSSSNRDGTEASSFAAPKAPEPADDSRSQSQYETAKLSSNSSCSSATEMLASKADFHLRADSKTPGPGYTAGTTGAGTRAGAKQSKSESAPPSINNRANSGMVSDYNDDYEEEFEDDFED